MKKGLLYNTILCVLSATTLFSCAYNNDVTNIKVNEAGTLASQLSDSQWDKVRNLSIQGPLNEIDIAFLKALDCNGLESLDLSKAEGLNKILFYFDSNQFSSITLPDNVEYIQDEAFQGCLNLKEVKINPANSHFKLIDGVLYDADSTRIVVYPALLQKKSYKISAKVKLTSNCLFASAKELENIEVSENNPVFCSINGVLYSKDTTSLITYPAGKADTSFTVPKEVVNVNWSAFWGADKLKAIYVENGSNFYTSIDGVLVENNGADNTEQPTFNLIAYPAGKKTPVYRIPNGITQISICAFKTCSLDTLVLNKQIYSIDKWAFNGSNIKHIEVDSGNINFTSESGIIYKGNVAYLCSPMVEQEYAIRQTTSIDERAFQRSKATAFTINKTLVTGPFFCSYCDKLKEIKIEDGIKQTDGLGAFFCCTELTKADLPESFEKVSNRMFFGCINLQTIICRAKKAPVIEKYAFTGVDLQKCTVYVPAESIENYRKNEDWKVFRNIKPIIE